LTTDTQTRIDPLAAVGAVDLTVSDLDRSIRFYGEAIGLAVLEREESVARLGAVGKELLRLQGSPGARRPPRTTGLYHFALLLPNRRDLATALTRLATAGASLRGAADHGVSEALYLSDPDGNGIEIYRDRSRDEWPRGADGAIAMVTDPLDLDRLLDEGAVDRSRLRGLSPDDLPAAPEGTRMGHIHLHVADLEAAKRFYVDVVGFDLVARYGAEALFVSAGGYHHHVGLNTWAGRGAPAPPPGSAGLRWFALEHSTSAEREKTLARIRAEGIPVETAAGDPLVRDPSGNGVRLTARA